MMIRVLFVLAGPINSDGETKELLSLWLQFAIEACSRREWWGEGLEQGWLA